VSKSPPPVFFCDRALGKTVVEALRQAGAEVEIHGDHFAPDSPDVEWLPVVSEWGWIVLTKDIRISKNLAEIQAIAQSNAQVFILASGNMRRREMADIFVDNLQRMEKFALGDPSPFIAKIYKPARVKLWMNHKQLRKYLK